jgi:hypothetical protein
MLTPRRSAGAFAVAQLRITCVVAEREDALAECPCVRSAASSTGLGIVPALPRNRQANFLAGVKRSFWRRFKKGTLVLLAITRPTSQGTCVHDRA